MVIYIHRTDDPHYTLMHARDISGAIFLYLPTKYQFAMTLNSINQVVMAMRCWKQDTVFTLYYAQNYLEHDANKYSRFPHYVSIIPN